MPRPIGYINKNVKEAEDCLTHDTVAFQFKRSSIDVTP
jgi:hypothetical protein